MMKRGALIATLLARAAADAAFAMLVAQHPGARELCPGVYAVPPDAVVKEAE